MQTKLTVMLARITYPASLCSVDIEDASAHVSISKWSISVLPVPVEQRRVELRECLHQYWVSSGTPVLIEIVVNRLKSSLLLDECKDTCKRRLSKWYDKPALQLGSTSPCNTFRKSGHGYDGKPCPRLTAPCCNASAENAANTFFAIPCTRGVGVCSWAYAGAE
jgi:hypothetical protein